MMLIVSVKSLMQYASQSDNLPSQDQIKMRDKDIENRVNVISEILSLGSGEQAIGQFNMPLNISISIYQTLINLVTN